MKKMLFVLSLFGVFLGGFVVWVEEVVIVLILLE